MRRFLLPLLTLGVAVAAATAGAANPRSPQVFSAALDGSDEQSLSGEQPAATPIPARDGRIVFTRAVDGRPTYWVMNADGSEQRALAPAPDETYFGPPAWSPDGQAIALSRWDYSGCGPSSRNCSGSEIVVVDVATASVQTVVRSRDRGAGSFSWAPGGSRLAYTGELDMDLEARAVETVRSDGTGRRVLLRLPVSAGVGYTEVAWSPRGDWIAYVRGSWIWLVRPDGGARTKLARGHTPVWSPGGGKLLFVSASGGSVGVVDVRTRRLRVLARADQVGFSPTWAPDGRRIAFLSRMGSLWTVATVRSSDGRRLSTWRPPDSISSIYFTRDGTRLLYSRLAP